MIKMKNRLEIVVTLKSIGSRASKIITYWFQRRNYIRTLH